MKKTKEKGFLGRVFKNFIYSVILVILLFIVFLIATTFTSIFD